MSHHRRQEVNPPDHTLSTIHKSSRMKLWFSRYAIAHPSMAINAVLIDFKAVRAFIIAVDNVCALCNYSAGIAHRTLVDSTRLNAATQHTNNVHRVPLIAWTLKGRIERSRMVIVQVPCTCVCVFMAIGVRCPQWCVIATSMTIILNNLRNIFQMKWNK